MIDWEAELPVKLSAELHGLDFGAVKSLVTRANEELDKVRAQRDMWKGECASISEELGLPPTIRPAEGELARFLAGYRDSLARIAELEAAQRWRPMSEAPTYRKDIDGFVRDEPVLLLFESGYRSIGERHSYNGRWHCLEDKYTYASQPIGWLPLPEPPKET